LPAPDRVGSGQSNKATKQQSNKATKQQSYQSCPALSMIKEQGPGVTKLIF
jgi:hypothetical protein